MKLPHQCRNDVARREVKIVARTIEIGWHRRDEIAPELAAICLTQLDARDLRNCIPLVCFLEWSGEQLFFGDRLRGISRVDTR